MVSSAASQPAAPTAQPSPGSLFAAIRTTLPALIPSERRGAEVCLRRADEVADWSAAQLATAAEVSAATVVRACQSMGFRGFQQLRVAFAREAGAYLRDGRAAGAGARIALREPRAGDPPDQIVDTVFELGQAVLTDSLTALDQAQVALAVDLLDGARRLLVVGNGGSAPVAQDTALRFLSVSRSVEAPADAQTQQLAAAGLSAADICLLITGSGVNELTFRVATIAREPGASIVLPTSYAAGPVAATGLDTAAGADRVLRLAGSLNLRDVGDYRAADGRRVRRRTLLRSAAMHGLGDQARAVSAPHRGPAGDRQPGRGRRRHRGRHPARRRPSLTTTPARPITRSSPCAF
ncbi:MurR/RpiR family transcriptional regulator [Pseudofrankia sp. DC12]|uniref:MurR/RpiR family transcriptional regulator n=1 Tax=Pseudofrankia sp. DC12 TaxID=683315 RepID=UPI000A63B7B9|nr:MurR/RpiR family transcriptional regulator [Pseudofrankia sp. DC12]